MRVFAIIVISLSLSVSPVFSISPGETVHGKCSFFTKSSNSAIDAECGPYYAAMRWDYSRLMREWGCKTVSEVKDRLKDCYILLKKLGEDGPGFRVDVCDWGPHPSTGRVIDLSPAVGKALDLETDDRVEATLCAPDDHERDKNLLSVEASSKKAAKERKKNEFREGISPVRSGDDGGRRSEKRPGKARDVHRVKDRAPAPPTSGDSRSRMRLGELSGPDYGDGDRPDSSVRRPVRVRRLEVRP